MKPVSVYRPPTPRQAAAAWIAERRAGKMSAEDLRAFEAWLAQDPTHAVAFEQLEALWDAAGEVREDPLILAAREWAVAQRPVLRLRFVAAVAACLVAMAGIGWMALGAGVFSEFGVFAKPQMQELRTGVGQTATVTLPDGSVVTLDTDTVLRASTFGRKRVVELQRGKAFFRVAKDPGRKFVVGAGDRTVTATGTAFEVRYDPGLFQVTLVEGKVAVEAPQGQSWRGQSTDMVAGWRLTERDGRPWDLSQVDVNKETSWLSGRLTFVNDPLGAAAAEANRYSKRKIMVDPKIANAPIVGIFKIGDVDGFVSAVRLTKLARVARNDEKEVELIAP